MSTSTYCTWAQDADKSSDKRVREAATASHRRCPGTSNGEGCACACHGHTTPPPTQTDEDRAPMPERRQFTEETKRAICEEYAAAPIGRKTTVLLEYAVRASMVNRWCRQFGIELGPQGGPRDGTGPKPTADDVDHLEPELLEPEGVEGELLEGGGVCISLEDTDVDVLDALAFLNRIDGGAAGFVADLVNDVLEARREDPSVIHLVALRQEINAR